MALLRAATSHSPTTITNKMVHTHPATVAATADRTIVAIAFIYTQNIADFNDNNGKEFHIIRIVNSENQELINHTTINHAPREYLTMSLRPGGEDRISVITQKSSPT
eukprot:scaffold7522_cov34-Cyclotella_meneghiniana.AAC.1